MPCGCKKNEEDWFSGVGLLASVAKLATWCNGKEERGSPWRRGFDSEPFWRWRDPPQGGLGVGKIAAFSFD